MRTILWTKNSIEDLKELQDYIGAESEFRAKKLVARIFQEVETISQFPLIGRRVLEFGDEAIRELIVSKYRVVHRVSDHEIIVLAIVHSRQDFIQALNTID